MPTNTKDPDEVLDYTWDWSRWLATGETISTNTITADDGITVDSSTIATNGKSVTAWLSGGTEGEVYDVACKIVTSASRTAERTRHIRVRHL